jgi:hypothetical protein
LSTVTSAKHSSIVKLLVVFCFATLTLGAAEVLRPFETPRAWTWADPGAWTWTTEDGVTVLTLRRAQDFKPKVRSPFNLAWFSTVDWQSFTLTVEARLTKFDAGNNDLCIAFAREDETRFYYAHLGEKADGVHHQIHLVDHADRRAITTTRTAGCAWQPGQWHRLKVVHDATTGTIEVYFDDLTKPALTARDRTLVHGGIGVGSFDDLGQFRNLEIRGERK